MSERVDGLTAAGWKRRYEGMVKERDDQIHRKQEGRRVLLKVIREKVDKLGGLEYGTADEGMRYHNGDYISRIRVWALLDELGAGATGEPPHE